MRFDRHKKTFIGKARNGRNERICDSDTMSAIGVRLLQSFDGLPQAASETDCNDQVAPADVPRSVNAVPRCDRGGNREAQPGQPVLEEMYKADGEVAAQNKNAPRLMNRLCQRGHAFHVKRIAKSVQIADVLLQSLMAVRAGICC